MQQYDQRRLRLFAVVLFLGIMAANLGRYLIFDGLYLWDARLRWQECAYVLHGLNPFDVMHSRVPSIESIGWLDASLGGTVPWAYVLGNVINPGFLPYSAMCVYILALPGCCRRCRLPANVPPRWKTAPAWHAAPRRTNSGGCNTKTAPAPQPGCKW